jgi:hypothetical protein
MKVSFLILLIALVSLVISCGTQESKGPITTTTTPGTPDSTQPKGDEPINTYAGIDISPMDMSYYPVDYPKLKMSKSVTGAPLARVIYSRPHLQGRKLFPDILKYGEPWRLGANEATELQLFSDATIQQKKINASRYVMYCIPSAEKWTIVLNSNIDTWGLEPDVSKDIARFDIPVTRTNNRLEYFSLVFEKTANGADLLMGWENVEARLPFQF